MIAKIPKPPAFNSPVITTAQYNSNPSFSFSIFLSSPAPLKFYHQRRRLRAQAASLVLSLLPFPTDQVLVPSEAKTLHLYEARYIALLEEDPIGFSGTSSEASFAARFGCLVAIEKVEQLKIGALVSIRGVGRVKVLKFKQIQPYLTGEVIPIQDKVSEETTEISSKVVELKEALYSLSSLEIKLKIHIARRVSPRFSTLISNPRVSEDVGTAGALRAIDHRLTAKDILVVSGDLITEIPPGAVAAAHRRHEAVVIAMFCSVPVSGSSDSGSAGAKDKAKKTSRYNIVGLDPTKQFLLHVASGAEVEKDIRVQKSIFRAVGQMDIRADLMDAHMYAFKRSVLQDVLNQKENFQSLRRDVLPYLVRSQLRSELLLNGALSDENGNGKDANQNSKVMLSQLLANASTPSFHETYELNSAPLIRKTPKCCVYIANKSKYCARLNSIQAYSDINRDVVGDASHLSGYTFSSHNNIIQPSAVFGSKTTVGPQCMLGEGSQMGDKCSVKKSVIGRHCRIGSNVKIVNSVVMNHVTIGDGCSIQGSIVCSNVQLQDRAMLKDCQVGAGFVGTAGGDYKGESLAKK